MTYDQKVDRILSCTNIQELEVTEAKCCFRCNRNCKGCRIDITIQQVRIILKDKIGG